MSAELPTLADVYAAADLLRDVVRDTPIAGARWLDELVGGGPGTVGLKCENLQRAGSFKIRGAYNRIAALTPEERSRGVVAASAGNHAQGVAVAAQLLGVKATVFMPEGAALPKVTATRGYGADVQFFGATLSESLVRAKEFAADTGAILIHPFDHPLVVAGQGTVGLEILAQRPDVRTIVVCTGGGGLLAGIALAVKSIRPDVRVIGVQAAGAASYAPSIAAGHPLPLPAVNTMADGIAVPLPGDVPFALVEDYVDEIRTVSEDSLSRAVLLLLERAKLVVEPAGAAAVAAILDDPAAFQGPVVAIVSGGNVDPLLLLRIIRFGLAAAGRFLSISVAVPDRPGTLAGLIAEIGKMGANVVEVIHGRTNPRLSVHEVEISVEVETRGPEHRELLLSHLADCGYAVRAD